MSAGQPETILAQMELAGRELNGVRSAMAAIVIGQEKVIERSLVTVLAGGHGLLVGLPGLAKTLLVETLGIVLGLEARRVQFTPDLMPADIIGSEVLEEAADGAKGFRFLPGPVFSQVLMADEINRASPRTQSALLQAMQEHHVSVAGVRYDLPKPFHVLATQNPLEQEGTYPLPEAQLDRFLLQIDVTYPEREAEKQILLATTGSVAAKPAPVLSAERLMQLQDLVRQMPVGEAIVEAILTLVRAARPGGEAADLAAQLVWSPGPRAAQALILASKARALLQGRLTPSLEDVAELAEPVLRHRMALSFAARANGASVEGLIDALVQRAIG